MATGYNQYIGMRYVPIIDGEWSQSKPYEPLVVVVYNGNSYISKTYVPAGTLPTNETYWILAANYNAQVEQYRQEVRQYQQTVEGFSGDIEDLNTQIGSLETQLDTTNAAITRIDKKPVVHWQLINAAVNTDLQTVYTTNNRKFSDFDFCIILWQVGNYIRDTEALPMSYLTTLSLDMTYVDTLNAQHWCDIRQLSDTSISVQSSVPNGYVIIYGIGGAATY